MSWFVAFHRCAYCGRKLTRDSEAYYCEGCGFTNTHSFRLEDRRSPTASQVSRWQQRQVDIGGAYEQFMACNSVVEAGVTPPEGWSRAWSHNGTRKRTDSAVNARNRELRNDLTFGNRAEAAALKRARIATAIERAFEPVAGPEGRYRVAAPIARRITRQVLRLIAKLTVAHYRFGLDLVSPSELLQIIQRQSM